MSDHRNAMKNVLEDMGRAAREGRARRFQKKSPAKGVDVSVGEVQDFKPDVDVDATAQGMSDDEMRELQSELEIQR